MMEAIIAVAVELIDSSDSSEEESVIITEFMRKKHNLPKIKNYLQVISELSDEQFKSKFRVSRSTAKDLERRFQNSEFYPTISHGGNKEVSAENQVLSFLWFAGNKCCLRDVCERFGVGKSTCFRQCSRVMDFLVSIAPEIIKFPKTMEEKMIIAAEFEKVSGFPDVIGCIDGSSINIRTPANKIKSTYVNRHDVPSVTLQGICDSKRRFLDVFTGAPGKIHDSRVFRLSFIYKEIGSLCNKRHHLLGDSAYAIRDYLLTPYRDYGTLTEAQIMYNKKFCATRVLIENSFGLLKGRFRQLMCLEFYTVDKITKFIIACCVLHNLCINRDDLMEDVLESELNSNRSRVGQCSETETHLRNLGELKRNYICEQFFHNRNN